MTLRDSLFASFLAIATAACTASTLEDLTDLHARRDESSGSQAPHAATPPATRRRACEGLEEIIRERAIQEMKERLASARSNFDWGCCNCGSAGPSRVSQTNNQVAGVDESDLVKTDGQHMYLATGNSLVVLAAWPAAETHVIAQVPLAGDALELFVKDGRAVVYASLDGGSRAGCIYGHDCSFTGDGSRTQITVFDVTDPSSPRAVRELTFSGSLIAARRIDHAVYTVVSDLPRFDYPHVPSNVPRVCRDRNLDPGHDQMVDEAFAALEHENENLLRDADMRPLLPVIEDSAGGDARCDEPLAVFGGSGLAFTTVHAFDMAADDESTAQTVISRPGATYVSDSRLYVAVTNRAAKETSTVHSFQLGGGTPSVQYTASAQVNGHVLNQFAMDEWNGALRIATTSGYAPSRDASSTISVLKQEDARLNLVGELGQLAPTEDIRSVRFVGAKGYVVTFRQTDPLFVFDLADPTSPKLQGELKIPGFSTYMHPMDEDNLLTIGQDVDDRDRSARASAVLIQIFDVSDPNAPKLRHKRVIDTKSSSDAQRDHLAFTYLPERNLLSLPMTICNLEKAGNSRGHLAFSGLILFDIDPQRGIDERGRVAHPPLATGTFDGATCDRWGWSGRSEVKRSVFMDDFVYSIAEDVVRVQSLDNLGTDLATIRLKPVDEETPYD